MLKSTRVPDTVPLADDLVTPRADAMIYQHATTVEDQAIAASCWHHRWSRSGYAVAEPRRVPSAHVTTPKQEGERVVLARRDKVSTMVPFHWAEDAPPGLNDLEWAEELGAVWEGDELVTYDYPTFADLLEYYESDQYLPDND